MFAGELPIVTGSVCIPEKIGYVTQEPWIYSATIRSNILFGQVYEEMKYEQVVSAVGLDKVKHITLCSRIV